MSRHRASRRQWHNADVIQFVILAILGSTAIVLGQEPFRSRRDRDCGVNEQLVGRLEGVSVFAHCTDAPEGQIMHVAVETGRDMLTGFGIDFCDSPVIEASAPMGWRVKRDDIGFVSFSVGDETPTAALVAGRRLDGFTITLKRPWMRSNTIEFRLSDFSTITATSHDCP